MFQTLFGVNTSIFKGAMAPGSEVTFFLARTSIPTLSVTIQSKKFSVFVIALFDNITVYSIIVKRDLSSIAASIYLSSQIILESRFFSMITYFPYDFK